MNAAKKHGIGLHTSTEIQHIAKQDLRAVSDILGMSGEFTFLMMIHVSNLFLLLIVLTFIGSI